MSSLPSLTASPFSLRAQPRMPATTAPVIITDTGMPTTSTSTMMACPSMVSSCPEVGPGFHLDERPEREVGHADRSEEHTSELQSLMRISYAVFCLKKKKTKTKPE